MISERVTEPYLWAVQENGMTAMAGVRICRYQRGEYLCHEADPLPNLLYILSGTVKVSVLGGNGRMLLICFYRGEGIIGSIEVLHDRPATASAQVASEEAVCLSVPIAANLQQMRSDADFLRRLCSVMSEMFARSSKNSAVNLLYGLRTRLCSYLLLAAVDGLFQEHLGETAALLCTSYRHLMRELSALCGEGLLARAPGGYRLLRPEQLEALAGDYYIL